MSRDLMRLMGESESIIDLEERLKMSGLEFPSYREYIQWLNSEWDLLSADRISRVLGTVPAETRFPTLTVESGGVEYQIHGIAHGYQQYVFPGWHARKNVRTFISRTADSFHRPSEGGDYLYEQNLHMLFGFIRSQELKDHDHTRKKPGSVLKEIGFTLLAVPVAMVALVRMAASLAGAYAYSRKIKNPEGKLQGYLYLTQRALTDERYQAHLADFVIAQEMPQPFNLEAEYLSDRDTRSLLDLTSMEPNPGTSGERSLWTARELMNYAKRRRLNRLHHIGGIKHATAIAYFLQHPNFSFERLENYRMSRRN